MASKDKSYSLDQLDQGSRFEGKKQKVLKKKSIKPGKNTKQKKYRNKYTLTCSPNTTTS